MRVIAGRFGGRRLAAPRGGATRPTADRVKEALFSMLGDVEGLSVLDLFAGTGALGIEALSRGASAATFVERSPAALAALRANLTALGLDRTHGAPRESDGVPRESDGAPREPDEASPSPRDASSQPRVEVRPEDALAALKRAQKDGERFDVVFLDPPYESADAWARNLAEMLPPVLAESARVVVESDRRRPLSLPLPMQRQRRYGDTSITIHRVDEPSEIDSGVPRVI